MKTLLQVIPIFFLLSGLARAQLSSRPEKGELFEIKTFKRYNTSLGRGLLLEFKVGGRGSYDLDSEVYLYDSKKRRISGGVEAVYLFSDSRFKDQEYSRNAGTGQSFTCSGYLAGERYSFLYVLDARYSFAVAEVGNRDEKVYSVIPYGKVEDFIRN